jgi:predicted RNase H-like HicB family nuclease
MSKLATKKNLKYYKNLNWSYTVEQETHKGKHYYIIRVNELPGVCTDAETIEEGMEGIQEAIEGSVRLYLKNGEAVPEPIKKDEFKGNIAYRTTSERHYYVAKAAKKMHKSISKTLDELVDTALEQLRILPQ